MLLHLLRLIGSPGNVVASHVYSSDTQTGSFLIWSLLHSDPTKPVGRTNQMMDSAELHNVCVHMHRSVCGLYVGILHAWWLCLRYTHIYCRQVPQWVV